MAVIVVLVVERAVVVGETLVVDAAVVATATVDGGASSEESALHETATPTRAIARLAVKCRCHFSIYLTLRVRGLSVNASIESYAVPGYRRCRLDEP